LIEKHGKSPRPLPDDEPQGVEKVVRSARKTHLVHAEDDRTTDILFQNTDPVAVAWDADDAGWDAPDETQQISIASIRDVPISSSNQEKACLVVIYPTGPMLRGQYLLSRSEYLIGRSPECDIIVDRQPVSRRHARLKRNKHHWTVQDLGSTNGLFIDGSRLEPSGPHRLNDGDQLRVGDTIFKFLSSDNIEAAYHEEVYRISITDGLTEAHNRRYLFDFMAREVSVSHRHKHSLSLILLDIDHFKRINDTYGHPVGDMVIKEIAARVQPRLRRTDCFARYGGEEFAVVLPHTDQPGAMAFAEMIRQRIAEAPMEADDTQIPVTASFGVATSSATDPQTAAKLMKIADDNLYHAKRGGRNRVTG